MGEPRVVAVEEAWIVQLLLLSLEPHRPEQLEEKLPGKSRLCRREQRHTNRIAHDNWQPDEDGRKRGRHTRRKESM